MKSKTLYSDSKLICRLFRLFLSGICAMLIAAAAHAAPEDLTLPCAGGSVHTFSFDNGDTVNEDIFAIPATAGNVFWELSSSSVGCTATNSPLGDPMSYACTNGLNIALPAGAPDASVSSAQPVALTATPLSAVGSTLFSLTATLDDGIGAQTCQKFIQVDVSEPEVPFDIVFVLDRSGSMGLTSGATSMTRWNALAEGVKTFLPFLQLTAPSGSKFGLTLFASSVLTDPLGGMINIDSNFTTTVEPKLTQTPSGSTAMGAGIQDAMSKMTDATRPRVIVLFTDGEENQDPDVNLDGCGFTNPTSKLNPDCPATSGYKVITTGIGSPSGESLATLEALGANNRGASMITDNGTNFAGVDGIPGDIGATFTATIGAALSSNSPQQVAFYAGPMLPDPNAPGPVILPGFEVNQKVRKLILSVTFSERFETPQLVQLLGNMTVIKDGADVSDKFEPILVGNFSSGATLVADFENMDEPIAPEGNYVVSLTLPPNFRSNLQFRLLPYVDDHRLGMDSTLSPSVKQVNQPIGVAVQLDWLDQGIENATVVVRAYGPGTDMGEALSGGEPVDPAGGEDASNAGIQKYDHLAANDPAFLEQLKLSPNAVTMTHQGGGLYTGTYQAPDIVGVVHFLYNVSADSPEFGKVQRTWYESAYARFDDVDMSASNTSYTPLDGGLIRLDFTPVRPSGKRIGPGQLSAFSFTGVTLQNSVDNQDGSYSFTVSGGNASTPIEVTLLGETIYAGPAGWGPDTRSFIDRLIDFLESFGLPWWLVLLIILIILVLIIVIIVRSRTSSP